MPCTVVADRRDIWDLLQVFHERLIQRCNSDLAQDVRRQGTLGRVARIGVVKGRAAPQLASCVVTYLGVDPIPYTALVSAPSQTVWIPTYKISCISGPRAPGTMELWSILLNHHLHERDNTSCADPADCSSYGAPHATCRTKPNARGAHKQPLPET